MNHRRVLAPVGGLLLTALLSAGCAADDSATAQSSTARSSASDSASPAAETSASPEAETATEGPLPGEGPGHGTGSTGLDTDRTDPEAVVRAWLGHLAAGEFSDACLYMDPGTYGSSTQCVSYLVERVSESTQERLSGYTLDTSGWDRSSQAIGKFWEDVEDARGGSFDNWLYHALLIKVGDVWVIAYDGG